MKQVVFGLLSGSIVLLFVGILLTLMTRNIRVEELSCSLSEAMEVAMNQYVNAEGKCTTEELENELQHALLQQISSDSEVTLHIKCADVSYGILSVEAEEHFIYPLGQKGSIRCERTILADWEVE